MLTQAEIEINAKNHPQLFGNLRNWLLFISQREGWEVLVG